MPCPASQRRTSRPASSAVVACGSPAMPARPSDRNSRRARGLSEALFIWRSSSPQGRLSRRTSRRASAGAAASTALPAQLAAQAAPERAEQLLGQLLAVDQLQRGAPRAIARKTAVQLDDGAAARLRHHPRRLPAVVPVVAAGVGQRHAAGEADAVQRRHRARLHGVGVRAQLQRQQVAGELQRIGDRRCREIRACRRRAARRGPAAPGGTACGPPPAGRRSVCTPSWRSSTSSAHSCGTSNSGSAPPLSTRSPRSTPASTGAALRSSVQPRWSGPRRSSATTVVTTFIADPGCIATSPRCCHGRAQRLSGSATAASASAGTPACCSAACTAGGRFVAGGRGAPGDAGGRRPGPATRVWASAAL